MTTTPRPWEAIPEPADTPSGVWLVVGPATDNGERHTIARCVPCDDDTHPGRAEADARAIVAAVTGDWKERAHKAWDEVDRLRGEQIAAWPEVRAAVAEQIALAIEAAFAPPEFDHGRAGYNDTLAKAARIARSAAEEATNA